MRVTGAYLSSSLGLCQNGRCLHRHWQMEKVDELISLWRIVVLCAETSTEPRLCARTFQYMLCMASSVRRGVSPATPLRTGFISRDAVSDGLRYRFLAGGRNDITCHHRRSLSPVTIDAAVRRSEGSGIPHRVSALVSPSGADPLLRSLRQGAGAQDDREGILFQLLRFAQDDREQILQDDSVYCAISFGFPALGA